MARSSRGEIVSPSRKRCALRRWRRCDHARVGISVSDATGQPRMPKRRFLRGGAGGASGIGRPSSTASGTARAKWSICSSVNPSARQLAGDRGRPAPDVVAVGGDHVDQVLLEQRVRDRADRAPEVAGERARGDRAQNPGVDERVHEREVALQGRRPFGVGEHDPVPAPEQLAQARLEAGGRRRERALDQHIGPAAQAQAGQRSVVELAGARHRDLGAGADLDVDPLGQQLAVDVGDGARHERRIDVRVRPAHVRRRHDRPSAVVERCAAHGQRLGHRRRAVIDPREDVAVEIDHRAEG